MTSTLFSSDWYKISKLKPKLRDHVSVHVHRYRGKRWYLLEDHITGQIRKLSPQSYLLAGLMNGSRTVDELWEISSVRLAEEMPTHEELLQLLASLYQANLVKMDISGDARELFERDQEAKRKRWMSKLRSPLSIQIPLVDPEEFIVKTQHFVKPLFTKTFAIIWCLLIINMLVLAGQHWGELTKGVSDRVLAADNLLLLWLIYPIIKFFHEMGHAYAVKRGGGEVHELGFMLLVLIPMPYVDASSSSAFADKKQRMLVGAAGIIVELFFAALAMVVWVNSEPGLIKSFAYNIIFIAGVSTLFINGNPLLKFDGYYVLTDLLEIPNFAQKANQYWGWLFKRVVFGVKGHQSPAHDNKEAGWLLAYGAAALLYRFFLMITIFLFVAQQYFFIGVVLAVWSIVGTWVLPNIKLLTKPWKDNDVKSGSRSPYIMMPILLGLMVIVLAVLPFPITTSVEGVVQYGESRRVVAKENCFLKELSQAPGKLVKPGEQLLSCENKTLETRKNILVQQYNELQAKRLGVWNDPVAIKIYDDELNRLAGEIDDNHRQIDGLNIVSESEGTWWISQPENLSGRFIKRGELLGYILDDKDVKVRAMIPEHHIKLIRENTVKVDVKLPPQFSENIIAKSWKVFPSTSKQVISPILSEGGGGQIVMNPAAEKPEALQPFFLVDLILEKLPTPRVDERVYVKFVHNPEPLIFRVYRLVRRTFLEYFDV